jgi:hypothetical protein
VVFPDRSIGWVISPSKPGNRYDVRSSFVTMQYVVVSS